MKEYIPLQIFIIIPILSLFLFALNILILKDHQIIVLLSLIGVLCCSFQDFLIENKEDKQ